MNTVWIVLPVLIALMFQLGIELDRQAFAGVARRPAAVVAGLLGQLALLPLIAFGVGLAFRLPPVYFLGLLLVACCPGGSSSNVFSMLAKGDVALSVSLTAVSSLITLFTVPLIMQATTAHLGEAMGVKLPVVNLLMQNVVTMLLPILLGIGVRHYWRETARKIERVLSRLAFPALMLLAGIFFVQHKTTIADNFGTLGLATTLLLLCATTGAGLLCYVFRLRTQERRTIVIEVGMQNAAQAIAVASSPFVFNDGRMAIPAIIYALMMNVILLTYVGIINRGKILG